MTVESGEPCLFLIIRVYFQIIETVEKVKGRQDLSLSQSFHNLRDPWNWVRVCDDDFVQSSEICDQTKTSITFWNHEAGSIVRRSGRFYNPHFQKFFDCSSHDFTHFERNRVLGGKQRFSGTQRDPRLICCA